MELAGWLFSVYWKGFTADEQCCGAVDSPSGLKSKGNAGDTEWVGQSLVGADMECVIDVWTAGQECDVFFAIVFGIISSRVFFAVVTERLMFPAALTLPKATAKKNRERVRTWFDSFLLLCCVVYCNILLYKSKQDNKTKIRILNIFHGTFFLTCLRFHAKIVNMNCTV